MDTKKGPKRRHMEHDTDSDSDHHNNSPSWPHFLTVCSTDSDRPITSLSPFAISKAIVGLSGEPKSVKKLRSGLLLIEVARKSHAKNLLRSKIFAGIPVKVEPHKTLNSKKGIIRCRDFQNESDESLCTELADQGVIEVRRIYVHRDGAKQKTNTFVVTFGMAYLPQEIKAGYLKISVDPYIPNPMRCFKCQRYGHHKDSCRSTVACARCGTDGHDDATCSAPYKCRNCKGDHPAFLKNARSGKQRKKYRGSNIRATSPFQRPGNWLRPHRLQLQVQRMLQLQGLAPTPYKKPPSPPPHKQKMRAHKQQ